MLQVYIYAYLMKPCTQGPQEGKQFTGDGGWQG